MSAVVKSFVPDTPERVASALSFIDASDRDLWVRMAFAVKECLGEDGKSVWKEWSRSAENFDEAAAEATWRSAKIGGSIKAESLFYLARQGGWKDDLKPVSVNPFEQARLRAERAQRDEQAAAEQGQVHFAAAVKAKEIWLAGATDVTGHGYHTVKTLGGKRGLDFGKGVRRGPWPQNGWNDALIVPIYGAGEKITSIEAISPTGEKMALKGGAKGGGIYPLMPFSTHESGVVIVAEGLATAAACMQATGYPAVAAFCDTNLLKAAELVKSKREGVRVVVVADIGSEDKARAAATAVGGVVAIPAGIPEINQGSDFWDIWAIDQGDALVRNIINDALKAGPVTIEGLENEAEPTVASDRLPTIELREGDRARIVKELASAFSGHAPYYRRDALLVRAITLPADDASGGIWRSLGSVVLRQASPPAVVADASRYAKIVKYDARSKRMVPKDLHDGVASAFCVLGVEQQALSSIIGIVRCPILREDGSLHIHHGYDPATKLILAGTEDWTQLNVPERPTIDDAKSALQWLLDGPFADFPFADEASRSVAVSALLTAVVRPAIPCAPLHGFSAPQFGAGKSLQAEFAAIVATGAKPSMIAPGHSQEEFEKRVDTALIEGDPVVVLDNLSRPLAGDNLCASLTSDTAKVRRLGSSDSVTVRTSAFWMATGMNLSVKRDMHRRTVISYIDAGMAHPEARNGFKIANLKEWGVENRMAILSAVYSMLRAHAQAGYPTCGDGLLGNFEEWSRRVANCLVWLGMVNPVRSQERLRADDPEYQNRIALMRALYDWQESRRPPYRSASWTLKDLREAVSEARGSTELSEAVAAGVHNGIDGARYWARSNKNVTVNDGEVDYKLSSPSNAGGGVARWEVVAIRKGQAPVAVDDESPI